MAIRLADQYVNHVAPDDAYPHGSFKNETAPEANDGTPLDKAWANNYEGFFQALIEAAGITPNGTPDTVLVSQYFDALTTLFAGLDHDHADHAMDDEVIHKTDLSIPQAELRGRTTLSLDTNAATWTTADMSTVLPVGTRYAILFLEIQADGPNTNTMNALMCRPNGTSGAGITAASINAGGDGGLLGNGAQVIVPVTSNRQLQFKLTSAVGGIYSIAAWYRVQGYIL